MPFIGIYSTPEYPLALVFEFMGHMNLREYLRDKNDISRLELVGFLSIKLFITPTYRG